METTMICVHIARPNIIKVQIPLDSLDLDREKKGTLQLKDYYKKSNYENENIKDISVKTQEYANFRI